MKFAALIAAACAGALLASAIPTHSHRNPFRAVFAYEQRQIGDGMTAGDLSIHDSAIKLSPIPLVPPQSLKLDLSQSFETQAELQLRQNDQRRQDLQVYTHNPSPWSVPPPN
ncbi:MAG TPA: hypothetical protein VHT03_15900 [Rhizomicrobium sp.]|jgi:hypothetical protein|nr:hypothetical protein [Rhizomicrobium sp.]